MSFNIGAPHSDPYRNFRFLIRLDGVAVAGMSTFSGFTQHEPITLGLGESVDTAFIDWITNAIAWITAGADINDFRRDITVEVYDPSSTLVASMIVKNACPSKLVAMPALDSKANEVAIETLELQHEGFVIVHTEVTDGPRSS
jgi:phage tail-like protein